MGVAAGNLAVLQGAQGPAGVVAEAALVVVAAVGCAAVGVAAGNLAVLQGTQGAAGVVAEAALVVVAAVNCATVGVAAGDGTVLIGADCNAGLSRSGISGVLSEDSAAMAAVGGSGCDQYGSQNGTQQAGCQTVCFLHSKRCSFFIRWRTAVIVHFIILRPPAKCKNKMWVGQLPPCPWNIVRQPLRRGPVYGRIAKKGKGRR